MKLHLNITFESRGDLMKKPVKYPSWAFVGHVLTNGAAFVGVMLVVQGVAVVRKWLLNCGMDPAMGEVFSLAEWLLMFCDLVVFCILVVRGANHFLSESNESEEGKPDAGAGVQSS